MTYEEYKQKYKTPSNVQPTNKVTTYQDYVNKYKTPQNMSNNTAQANAYNTLLNATNVSTYDEMQPKTIINNANTLSISTPRNPQRNMNTFNQKSVQDKLKQHTESKKKIEDIQYKAWASQPAEDVIYRDNGLTNGDVDSLDKLNLKYYGKSGSADAEENYIRDYLWAKKQLYSAKTGKDYIKAPTLEEYIQDVENYETEKDKTFKGKVENVTQKAGQAIKTMANASTSAVTNIYDSITKPDFKMPLETKNITSYNPEYSNMSLLQIAKSTGDKELASKSNQANHAIGQLELWAKTYATKGEAKQIMDNLIAQLKNGTYQGTDEDVDKTIEQVKTIIANENKTTWANDLYAKTLEENEYRYSEPAKKFVNALGTATEQLPTLTMAVAGGAPASTFGIYSSAEGSAMKQALNEGATYDEAKKYGMGVGLAETGIETLAGGVTNKVLGIPGFINMTSNITNPYVRGFANYTGDVLGESFEEGISGVIEPYIRRATYDENAGFKDFGEALTAFTNNYVESILPTMIMSGGSNIINTTQMAKVKKDVDNYYNELENVIKASNLTEGQKQEMIGEIENAKKEVLKQAFNQDENLQNTTQNNTNLAQTSPNNEQISQNNVQNVSNLENTVQKTNDIEKSNNTIYNQAGGVENEPIQRERMLGDNNEQTRIYENGEQEQINKYTREQYAKFEQSIKPIATEKLTNDEQNLIKEYKNKYNKDIVLFENDSDYGGGASLLNSSKIYIDMNTAKEFGYKRIATHEVLESDILHDNSVKSIMQSAINDIINDSNFQNQKIEFWDSQDGEIPSDYLIAKDIICDRFAEIENNERNDYKNVLSENTNRIIDSAINEYKKVKNSTQGSFLMPSNEQLQAQDKKQGEEIYNALNMKKPKLEDIAKLTEEQAQLPTMTYKQRADKNTPYRRKFWDNVETSKIVSDKVKEQVNMTNYERKHNSDVLETMKERLDAEPMKVTQEWFRKDIKKATEQDVALGAILLERLQQEGRFEEAVDVVEKLGDMGTEAGRTVQMYSIFQRLTPEGMMIYQQRKLNSALETLTQKQTGKWVEQNKDKFKLTEDDATFITAKVQEAQNAPTERQKQIALSEIEKRINDKLPPEAGQSVKAFRRIAMLFNPKTQVRNVVGNMTVMPLNYVTDLVATGIDKAVAKKTGVRTTALPNVKTIARGAKKGWNETWDDYKRGIRTTPTGSKYEIQNNVKSFNENTNSKVKNAINKKMNAIDRLLSSVMEAGDRPFYEASYQNALEGQMKANGVTEPTQEMIDIASNVALSQTWQDNNNYTQAVLGIRSAFNKININGFGLGDLIIPFAKTPANLTKAMVDYSPAGLIPSIINYNDMRKAISRGDMTATQQKKFVTSVGKAVAGTILYTIAGALAQGGGVTGSSDEDKDVANFEKNVLGIQPYSIKIGDKTYTYNWAQPLATPLAIMSDTYKMSEEGAKWNEILVNAFKVAGDQLVANSFLQGIQELLSSEYGNESAMDNLVGAIMDLPTQFTPTLLGQIATQFDSTKRQTFENGNTVGTMLNEVKNKIPGAKNTLAPQVNTFGEEIQNYGGANNPFNVFLNPGNISSTNATDTQKELYALYEVTKDNTIFPRQAPYSVSGGGEKVTLSSQDRADYQKTSGQYVTEHLDALFNSEFYKSLEDGKKVDVVAKIVSDADTTAKDKWIDTESTEKLAELKTDLKESGIPLLDYYNAWIATQGLESDKNWKGETITNSKSKKQKEAIDKATPDLDKWEKRKLYEIFNVGKSVW